tara:strand:- start:48 stop:389 length:342 start_codon:yes stop_codon:yes gene_type:complete
MGFLFLFVLFFVVPLGIIPAWLIYAKAGKPGWACIVPIYSGLVLLEIVNKPWWFIFLLFVPFVGVVVSIWLTNLLSKSFGKGVGFTIGLLLLPFIFYPILGYGSSTYKKLVEK